MAAKLDSRHHTFLQAVMNRGPLSEKDAMAMYKALVKSISGDGFVSFLGAINKELEYVQMELKKVMNQYDGTEFYGLINTLPSKEAKLGTKYTLAQIVFFTAVMEAIVQDPLASGVITSTAALNLKLEEQVQSHAQDLSSPRTMPVKLSMQAKEDTLSQMVADQLLSRTSDGGVALGVKAFLELRTVFRNLEVPFCEVCNEAAVKADICSNEDCSVRMHSYCALRKFARNQRPKCSVCKTDWILPVQEDGDATGLVERMSQIATQQPVQKLTKRSKSHVELRNDSDEDEHIIRIASQEPAEMPEMRSFIETIPPAGAEEDENEISTVNMKRQRPQPTRKFKIVAPDEDEDVGLENHLLWTRSKR